MFIDWQTKNTFIEINGIKAPENAVKCLGMYIGHAKEQCYNKNWMEIYNYIEKTV